MIFIMVLILISLITRKVSLITGSSFTCVSDLSYKMSVFFGLFLLDASFSSYQLVEVLYIFYGEGNGTPLQYSCLENPMDGGAWWAAVHGVVKSRIWLSDFTFTFHFHALEKEMATHSCVLAWRIPGTGEPGGLLSMGSHRVGHNWSDLAAAAAECCLQDLSFMTRDWTCAPSEGSSES